MDQNINIKVSSLQDKQKEITNFILNISASETKYHVIRASRQSGKTFLLERLALILAYLRGESEGAFIMATNSQCRKVFRSMKKWLPKSLLIKSNNTDGSRSIEFSNGTMLSFYSSGSYDSVAGNSFDFMICDEFGLWNSNAWGIIRPTLAAKPLAKVIIASTPRGKNDFYKMCMEGQDDTDTFVKEYRMSYRDNEHYDKREVISAKKSMSHELFMQEYMAEFIDGISDVFGEFSSVQRIKKYTDYIEGHTYVFGLDVSGEGEDRTVLTIIDKTTNKVSLIYTVEAKDPSKQIDELYKVLSKYGNNIRGYVEDNGLGVTFLSYLKKNGINAKRWHTTQDTKQSLINTTLMCFSENRICIPTGELCSDLEDEMVSYIGIRSIMTGKMSYRHPSGGHDDYVDSLMMSIYAMEHLKGSNKKVRLNYGKYRR